MHTWKTETKNKQLDVNISNRIELLLRLFFYLSRFFILFSSSLHSTYLAGAHRAPIVVQHPDLPTVLDLVVMDTVAGAVMPVGAPTVISSLQVEAHRVVGTGVPPCLAFIYICREHNNSSSIPEFYIPFL